LENIVPVNFRGVLQCDAYAAYPAFAGTREGIELVGCWAHARRHFHDAREHVPLRANWVLYQIQNLYRIEARLRESKAGPALRAAVRTSQSTMILNRLKRALEKMEASQRHLPSSTFGEAINSTLSHWELLTKYVANGRIEPERSAGRQPQAAQRASAARQIDNNGVENAIRPTAVGMKNWLFFGELTEQGEGEVDAGALEVGTLIAVESENLAGPLVLGDAAGGFLLAGQSIGGLERVLDRQAGEQRVDGAALAFR
jgi:hypothetical protein